MVQLIINRCYLITFFKIYIVACKPINGMIVMRVKKNKSNTECLF